MPVYTSHDEIQTAMYNALMPSGSVDGTLSGLGVVGVYDWRNVPQNANYDYITLGDGYELPEDTFGPVDGWKYYPTLHIWSRQRNTRNAALMVGRLHQLFHNQQLALPTLNNCYCQSNR